MKSDFAVTILPPEVATSHSNLPQWLTQADHGELGKHPAFYARAGSAFFVPFGHTMLAMCISRSYVEATLGDNAKTKAESKKKKLVTASWGSFLIHPLFNAERDAQQPEELRTITSYTWTQAKTWIPRKWISDDNVAKYWDKVSVGTEAAQKAL